MGALIQETLHTPDVPGELLLPSGGFLLLLNCSLSWRPWCSYQVGNDVRTHMSVLRCVRKQEVQEVGTVCEFCTFCFMTWRIHSDPPAAVKAQFVFGPLEVSIKKQKLKAKSNYLWPHGSEIQPWEANHYSNWSLSLASPRGFTLWEGVDSAVVHLRGLPKTRRLSRLHGTGNYLVVSEPVLGKTYLIMHGVIQFACLPSVWNQSES